MLSIVSMVCFLGMLSFFELPMYETHEDISCLCKVFSSLSITGDSIEAFFRVMSNRC